MGGASIFGEEREHFMGEGSSNLMEGGVLKKS